MAQLTVITGASSGIGLETAKGLAQLGHEIVKPVTYDIELAARLWTVSEQLTALDDQRAAMGHQLAAIGSVPVVERA